MTLSPRQTDVAMLIAEGLPNKEIACRLGIGERSVKTHAALAMAKYGVKTRTALAVKIVRQQV